MLFIIATFLVSVIAFAFAWYVNYTVFGTFQATGQSIMQDLDTNSTTTDIVDTFFTNAANYILVLALIGVTIWAFQCSQKKGVVVYD